MKKTILSFLIIVTVLLIAGCGTTQPGENEYNKGIEANNAGNMDLAQQLFEEAIKKNPTMAEAYINLGMVHIKQHAVDKAWSTTQNGLSIILKTKKTIIRGDSWQAQAALAYNNLAKIVFDKAIHARTINDLEGQRQEKAEALKYLKQASELSPDNELIATNIKYIERWPN